MTSRLQGQRLGVQPSIWPVSLNTDKISHGCKGQIFRNFRSNFDPNQGSRNQVPEGGMGGLTEECFNKGHLSFSGRWSWIYKYSTTDFKPDGWQRIKAVRTRRGTFPEGSEWAKIELPDPPTSGVTWKVAKYANWAFKDKVHIPADLETGQYVLSFRWDCQGSPQVWSACANINIV